MSTSKSLNKKREAFDLYAKGSFSQKDIAQQVGVSEKTIGTWVKAFGWRKLNLGIAEISGNNNAIIEYLAYIKDKYPEFHDRLNYTFAEYITNATKTISK